MSPGFWHQVFFSKKTLGNLCVLQVALLCFSFPITSAIPVILGMDSYLMNLGLKFLFLILSLYLLVGASFYVDSAKVTLIGWLIVVFWIVYSVRIIYDTQVEGIIFGGNLFKLYAVAFGNCLIGSLATMKTVKYASLKVANDVFLVTTLLSCLSVLATIYFLQGTINPAEIIGRARFRAEFSPGVIKDVLNPITISLYGELLALLALANLAIRKHNWLKKISYIITFIIGILVLILGASRGPVLGTAVGFVFCVAVYLRFRRKTPLFIIRVVTIPILFITVLVEFIVPKFKNIDFTLLQRLSEFNDKIGAGGKEERDFQWASAWDQFLENPIIGDQYLERYSNFYPHNIYLESLMATGIFGGVIFIGLILFVNYNMFLAFYSRQHHVVFFALVLAVEIAVLTSGSLFGSVQFWVLFAFVGSVSKQQRSSFNLSY